MARGDTFRVTTEMVVEQCCNCGIEFAFPETFKRECRNKPGPNGKSFYCPNGHPQHYTGETEAAKLRRERDRLKQDQARLHDRIREANENAEHERRRANGYKGYATKITNRAKAGVCPCCNRSFQNLRRHMESKHPKFTPECADPPLKLVEGGKQ